MNGRVLELIFIASLTVIGFGWLALVDYWYDQKQMAKDTEDYPIVQQMFH